MTKTGSSRFMSMFLSVCMIISCMVGMSVTASADETTVTITMNEQSFSNQQVITSITSGDVTINADKGNNNSLSPRYFTNGEAVRFYSGNSFTVTASENVITKIELSFGSGGTNNAITVDTGELSEGTWTGSATSVKFTIGGSYGFRGIASVAVTYEAASSTPEESTGAESKPLAVNTIYNIGDAFVVSADNTIIVTDDADEEDSTRNLGKGNYTVPQPSYSNGWQQWVFNWGAGILELYLGSNTTNGSENVTGIKCVSGNGTQGNPYKFELVTGSSTPQIKNFVRATSAEELETNLPNIPTYTKEQAEAWIAANKATLAPAFAAHMQAHDDAFFIVVYAISEGTYSTIDSGSSDLSNLYDDHFSLGELKNNFTDYYDMIYYPEVTAATHTHTWGYNASGATITANCTGTGDCDITEGLTMTISAPASTSLTYDGTAKSATLSTGYNTTAFPGTYTIEYYNGTTKLDSAPVNAGTYTAKVTAGTGDGAATASVDFTINPKTVDTPTITLSPESFTYDGTAKQPTVTVKDGSTVIEPSEYNVEYSNNTNAGTAKVTITDNAGGNYRVSGEKTFTIERGSQSAPVVSSTNETIDGKADGTITGVTTAMEYKSAAANEYTAVTGTTIANLPAGTYNVRYKENANYNASPDAEVVINTGSKITVQFDADGGSPEPDSQQFSYSQTVTKPETDPEKTGYTFLYWSADGEAEYDFSASLTANITIKAVYQANSYTITFDTDGGSEVAAITQEYGTAVTAPADPTKTGYTFAGWDKEIPATMPAESMTITAQWTVNRYTMTFDDNGSHSEYVLDYGTNLTEYIPEIQWEGHTFMGWNPEVPETVPAEDMTFTAVWDTNTYTITFDSNGGSYVAPIVQDYGTKVIAPMNPMREGYAFIGWDTAIPDTMPAYDMTVKAQWVKAAGTGAARISSGTARVPSGTAQPEVTVSSTDEITPKMWAVLNDDNSVTVSWEKIKNADSYILYVEKNGKAVKLTETKDTEVTLKNAKNGETYKFSLKYTRNDTTYSAPKGYKANLRVNYKPAVTATATKDGKILLKWNKVANADKYVIYRVNASGKLVKAGTTTKTAARIAAKSTDTGYVVRANVNGKLTKVTKSDIAAVTTE